MIIKLINFSRPAQNIISRVVVTKNLYLSDGILLEEGVHETFTGRGANLRIERQHLLQTKDKLVSRCFHCSNQESLLTANRSLE